jgi:mono/diheme cytochrome c family protein
MVPEVVATAALILFGVMGNTAQPEPGGKILRTETGTAAPVTNSAAGNAPAPVAAEGYRLFDHNCAQCHGDDARGDEGPDLHGVRKSDERFRMIIRNGIKGQMPAFGKKFKDADIEALIAYLRTLKE